MKVLTPVRKARSAASHAAFMWDKNLIRLAVAISVLAVLVWVNGVRGVVQGAIDVVGLMPVLALQLAFVAFLIIFQFVIMFWFLSRPRKYTTTPDDPQIDLSFDNYRGQPDLLEHAKSTVRILRGQSAFKAAGGEMPKGMLLSGEPGTGKTFLASVIAAEGKLPFIYIDASSLRGMFWGMDALMVMKLFRDARGLARKYAEPGERGVCILFMDELDSIGLARGGQGTGVGMPGGVFGGGSGGLNTLLNQMDSLGDHVEDRWFHKILRWFGIARGPVKNKPLVFVIGATNRPEVLDSALTRPGRLDRILEVYAPDGEGRRDIILHYLAKKSHEADIPIDFMVGDSIGWTPAMIKTIINEALVLAYEEGRPELTYRDWLAAADARTLGLKQPIRRMHDDDRRAIAYHEAGHAVAAYYLQPENRIIKATIIRRGGALGVVQPQPREERYTRHARQFETQIMTFLGSRAVEEEILETKLTGASSDLMVASSIALGYCGIFGMGSGLLVMPPQQNALSYPMPIARMAASLLDTLMVETKRLIREKEYAVHAVAGALLEKGELIGTELEEVFDRADAMNPDAAGPFERQLFSLPRLFDDPSQAAPGASEWPAESTGTAAASWELLGDAGASSPSQPSWTIWVDAGPVPQGDFHAPPPELPGRTLPRN